MSVFRSSSATRSANRLPASGVPPTIVTKAPLALPTIPSLLRVATPIGALLKKRANRISASRRCASVSSSSSRGKTMEREVPASALPLPLPREKFCTIRTAIGPSGPNRSTSIVSEPPSSAAPCTKGVRALAARSPSLTRASTISSAKRPNKRANVRFA